MIRYRCGVDKRRVARHDPCILRAPIACRRIILVGDSSLIRAPPPPTGWLLVTIAAYCRTSLKCQARDTVPRDGRYRLVRMFTSRANWDDICMYVRLGAIIIIMEMNSLKCSLHDTQTRCNVIHYGRDFVHIKWALFNFSSRK